jgi:hypothetical protein
VAVWAEWSYVGLSLAKPKRRRTGILAWVNFYEFIQASVQGARV